MFCDAYSRADGALQTVRTTRTRQKLLGFLSINKQTTSVFLAVCLFICRDVDVLTVSKAYAHGGMIGHGNAYMSN